MNYILLGLGIIILAIIIIIYFVYMNNNIESFGNIYMKVENTVKFIDADEDDYIKIYHNMIYMQENAKIIININ